MEEKQLIENNKLILDHAWKYFSLHADQRIKTFNFFIILATVALGAVIQGYTKNSMCKILIFPSLLITAFSLIFWKLDKRNKDLVRLAELAMIEIETHVLYLHTLPQCSIFKNESIYTAKKHKNYITYSKAFDACFFTFSILGIVLAVLIGVEK